MRCMGLCTIDNQCKGEINIYSIHSKPDHTYPNRYWGNVSYCETAKEDDEGKGFILTPSNDTNLVVL